MDIDKWKNKNDLGQHNSSQQQITTNTKQMNFDDPWNIETLKNFLRFTGGSLFYCISAVLVAYGIVNLLGPLLSDDKTFTDALPCIITLHVYELALLAVLILIVWRKVVDDAVSLMIFVALFLIGTSMALGTISDKSISMSFLFALIGIGLGFGKLLALRRFVKIRFKLLTAIGLGIVITYNYLSPIVLAKSIATSPAEEPARRALWMLLSVGMMAGAGLVIIEAMIRKTTQTETKEKKDAFLQRPIMVYIFSLILIIVSGVHQYAMGYTFAFERTIGDYIPVTLMATLVFIEILRHSGRKFGIPEIAAACIPLTLTLVAIQQKSLIAAWTSSIEVLFYPPVILAVSGLVITALALYHGWHKIFYVSALYLLGVILTIGYSPAYPHDLNYYTCLITLSVGLFIYGIVIHNQYVCISSIAVLCLGLSQWKNLEALSTSYQLTPYGSLSGICGAGIIALYLWFADELNKPIRILGAIFLAAFVFDYLPGNAHWKYILVTGVSASLMAGLWLRTKDLLVIVTLWLPMGTRLYILAKQIAHWRYVILGFLLLIAGTVVSLLKHPARNNTVQEEPENST